MDTSKLFQMLKTLDEKRAYLKLLKDEAHILDLTGHQQTVRVSIGEKGRSIYITTCDRSTSYASVQIRGLEMVLLGIKKWYGSAIQEMEEFLRNLESQIKASIED